KIYMNLSRQRMVLFWRENKQLMRFAMTCKSIMPFLLSMTLLFAKYRRMS
ncbi:hypothetical protein WOSG25_061530, partial [Weissella oryzae SG25]